MADPLALSAYPKNHHAGLFLHVIIPYPGNLFLFPGSKSSSDQHFQSPAKLPLQLANHSFMGHSLVA